MRINKKGSALAYALVMIAVVSIILGSMLQYISSQFKFSLFRGEREQAFQTAEAGIYFYRWYLAHQISGKTTQQIKTFWQSGHPYGVGTPYEAEFFDPEGGAIGRYKIEVQPPASNSTIVMVKSTGWSYKEPDTKRIIQVRFRRQSWSEFAVIANDVMRFGPGTEVFGRIHSNDGIRFDGIAHNIVSSAMDKYDDPDHNGNEEFGVHTHVDPPPNHGGVSENFVAAEAPPSVAQNRADIFLAGRQFPLPTVDFNGMISDLNLMKAESQTAGHGIYYGNEKCGTKTNYGRHIIINGDKMTVSTVTKYSNGDNSIMTEACVLNNVSIPVDGIVFVENNLWLEGTINNRHVTFVAANLSGGTKPTVFMGMNNLLYTNFDGRDIIGIIAQQDIEIIKGSLDNLTIDAALLAQSGRVGRNNYSIGCNSPQCQDHKGIITINGALATDLRYGFALSNGNGYSQRILNFDNNLLYFPPPYFPTGTEYSIDLWDEL